MNQVILKHWFGMSGISLDFILIQAKPHSVYVPNSYFKFGCYKKSKVYCINQDRLRSEQWWLWLSDVCERDNMPTIMKTDFWQKRQTYNKSDPTFHWLYSLSSFVYMSVCVYVCVYFSYHTFASSLIYFLPYCFFPFLF
jgi:hypothetical protein